MKPYSAYKPSGVPWLGDIPAHWRMKRLKFYVDHVGEKTSEPLAGISYVGLEHIESGTGKFISSMDGTQTESESTVSHFRAGDVLFGKLRPYLAKAVIADNDGVCTTELLVLRPHSMASGYLLRCLLLDGVIKTVDASTFGSKMPRADWTFIGNLLLPEPSVEEQQAISFYLDHETARIDILISEKRRLINTLREYRQATISEVVTQGLDSTVPKKYSGVPWMGEVPKHWDIKKVKHVARHTTGWTPPTGSATAYEGDNCWANIGDLGMPVITETKNHISDEAVRIAGITRSPEGSLLFSFKLSVGQVSIAGAPLYTNEAIATFLPSDSFSIGWAFYSFPAFIPENSATNIYGARLLNQQRINDAVVLVPPICEQQAIASYLDHETASIDKLLSHVQDEIKLLQELRAAAITDAVTGKIRVL